MNASDLRDRINKAWATYRDEMEYAARDAIVAAIQHFRGEGKKTITPAMIFQALDEEFKIVLPYDICNWRCLNLAVDEVDFAYVQFGPDGLAVIIFVDDNFAS